MALELTYKKYDLKIQKHFCWRKKMFLPYIYIFRVLIRSSKKSRTSRFLYSPEFLQKVCTTQSTAHLFFFIHCGILSLSLTTSFNYFLTNRYMFQTKNFSYFLSGMYYRCKYIAAQQIETKIHSHSVTGPQESQFNYNDRLNIEKQLLLLVTSYKII